MICKTCTIEFKEHHNTQKYCSDSCTPYKNKFMAWDTWRSMHKRCYDPKTNGYDNYGGAGIAVCERWHNYHNFIEDMGLKPYVDYQIDRIDSKGNYEPSNCRWVSCKSNQNNRKNSVTITFGGVTQGASDWAKLLGLANSTFVNRLKRMTAEQAILTPKGVTGPKPKRG